MKKFMISGSHGKAMRKLAKWCDEAVTHWNQASSELPTWLEAYERLRKEGRRSKVNHPSEGQVASAEFSFCTPSALPSKTGIDPASSL
jgi:hypothetical protein